THDGVNATLPADLTPETITLEQAVGLLEARHARGGKQRAPAQARSAAAKAAPKLEAVKAPARRKKKPPRKNTAEGLGRRVGIARSRFPNNICCAMPTRCPRGQNRARAQCELSFLSKRFCPPYGSY